MVRGSGPDSHPGLWAPRRHQPLGLPDCNPPPGVPLLRLWPRAVPIPVRPAGDRHGGQSGAGAGDAPLHPAIPDPPLTLDSALGLRVTCVWLLPGSSHEEDACCGEQLRHLRPGGGGGPPISGGCHEPRRQARMLT